MPKGSAKRGTHLREHAAPIPGNRSTAHIGGGGGGGGPGVLGRVLDVMSRPQYAISNAVLEGFNPQKGKPGHFDVGKLASGFGKGITGRDKTGFEDVLAAKGVEGPLGTIGGLAMNLIFDPTTYVGAGVVRRGIEAPGVVADLSRGASRAAAGRALGTGGAETAARVAEAVRPSAQAGRTGAAAMQLRFAGKPIVESERAYNLLNAVGVPIKGSRAGQLLSETFRPGHGQSSEFHNMQRMFAGRARTLTHDMGSSIRDTLRGTTKEQDRLLRRAIQEGTVHALDDHLRPVGEWMESVLDRLDQMDGVVKKVRTPGTPRFRDYEIYRGAGRHYDRASHNLLLQFDETVKKFAHKQLVDEALRRFPDDAMFIQQSMKRAREVFGVEGANAAAWQHYLNRVQAPWKRWVTAYRPGFHLRNMMGDAFNNFLAGVNPRHYATAGKVMANEADAKLLKLAGHEFTTAELHHLYRRAGLDTSFLRAEEIDASTRGIGARITELGDKRERFGRMANFIDGFEKELSKGKSVDAAMEAAGARTRKYLFDYGDLTDTERKIRSFIPFYTWTRKELPLILEHTLTTPGKMLAVPKGTRALESLLGIPKDPDDPFPGLEGALPPWLKDQHVIQMPGSHVAAPGLPIDLLGMLDPRQFAEQTTGGLTPVLKVPYAMATNKEFGTGYPQKESLARYLLSQGPWGTLAREGSPAPISDRLWNILLGMGYRKVEEK